jgi:hypothetical protein
MEPTEISGTRQTIDGHTYALFTEWGFCEIVEENK